MQSSYLGVWNTFWRGRGPQEECPMMRKTIGFINGRPEIHEIEDWGCGVTALRKYIDPRIRYIGLDGSDTGYQTRLVDLTTYKSNVDAIFMRHVLEHNWAWQQMLQSVLLSFQKRAIVIVFTPWSDDAAMHKVLNQHEMHSENKEGQRVVIPDLALPKAVFMRIISDCQEQMLRTEQTVLKYKMEEGLPTNTVYGQDHIFFFEKTKETPQVC